MIHPSYSDLMAVVNSEVEPGEQPVVQSRYSIVLATAKRARQIVGGDEPLIYRKAEAGQGASTQSPRTQGWGQPVQACSQNLGASVTTCAK